MKKIFIKAIIVPLILLDLIFISIDAQEKQEKKGTIKIEKERSDFKLLLLKNINYFGTFPKMEVKPVKLIKNNTKYEELNCLGFYPEQDLLKAIIDIKLSYGYRGNLCTTGSHEYVRFFIDWNGDGDFKDEDEDAGISSVNVHDIPDTAPPCLNQTKPISYSLFLQLDPKKSICIFPKLVKVRAILSWELPPTQNDPDFPPVWGNVIEEWIQIKPKLFLLKDIIKYTDIEKIKLKSSMLELESPISKTYKLEPWELKQIYSDKDISELRFNFSNIYQTIKHIKEEPTLIPAYKMNQEYKKIIENIDLILAEKSNTKYEKLNCVGLNYDLDTLAATLTVKLPYGYSGDLCSQGSNEYIAFWAYTWDTVEQMCSWRYLGTASVNVHDIQTIPSEGLVYSVKLPVDFSSYKDKCSTPKLLKIRGILSWQTPPPTNNPNYSPIWGNKVDCIIQLKPQDPVGFNQVPFISVVGGMAIESISGNSYSVIPSTIGNGYANGASIYGGFNAKESPFGGNVVIAGHISNPPDISGGATKLKYKAQYKHYLSSNWNDLTNKFRIWISTWDGMSWSMTHKDQTAATGYYTYEEDLTPTVQHFVEGNVFAQFTTSIVGSDGLYEIRLLLYKAGAPGDPINDVPPDHVASNIVRIMIDNTAPTSSVSLDLGPCTKYKVGDLISGKFTATDKHIWYYRLSIIPSVANPPSLSPAGATYPILIPPGLTNNPFTITTTSGTTPCGYVVHLGVRDRTIRNNHMDGNYTPASVGLCLLEED